MSSLMEQTPRQPKPRMEGVSSSPSTSANSSRETPLTSSSTTPIQSKAPTQLVFINNIIHPSKIDTTPDTTLIIRAFLKYVQFVNTRVPHNKAFVRSTRLNATLFNRYFVKFLNLLNITGYNVPFQRKTFTYNVVISFRGPFLSPYTKSKHHYKPLYSYYAEADLNFFNICGTPTEDDILLLKKTLVSFFVKNPKLLKLPSLSLPGGWILNTVDIKTSCCEL